MAANFITQTEFAKRVGVTKGAIWLAVRRDPPAVHVDEETKKIDPDHPLNVAYMNNREKRTSKRQQNANISKAIAKEIMSEELETMMTGMFKNMMREAGATPTQQAEEVQPPAAAPETTSEVNAAPPTPEPRQANPVATPGNDLQGHGREAVQAWTQEKGQKAALDNLKIQEKQMKIAELSGELARRDHVEKFMSIIFGTISNYFLPLDFRLTATIMDICGINDPKVKLEISEAIAKETTAGLAQVKKQAEEFALSLNPAFS